MDPCYVLIDSSAKMCPASYVESGIYKQTWILTWGNFSKETGEDMTWFPLAAYSKMWDDQFNQWTAALTYTHDL